MSLLIVLLAIALMIFVYFVGIYNGLVALRERVKQAWVNIDGLLRQRHDELPKLIDTCGEYLPGERRILESVMQARSAVSAARESGSVAAVAVAEQQLRAGLSQLYAVAENCPPLKANESFQQLRSRLSGLEQSIADRRALYNEKVRLNNLRVGQFPDVLIARRYGFAAKPLLE